MRCPFCGTTQIMVVNSRPTNSGIRIWRRRKCLKCKGTFTTYERINPSHLIVVKKSGKHQKYSRAKLYSSIYHSSIYKKGADRGEMSQLAEEITNTVERQMIFSKKKRVSTDEINEIVYEILGKKAPSMLLRYVAYKEGESKKKLKGVIKKYF